MKSAAAHLHGQHSLKRGRQRRLKWAGSSQRGEGPTGVQQCAFSREAGHIGKADAYNWQGGEGALG